MVAPRYPRSELKWIQMNASQIHKCPPGLKCLHCGIPFPKRMSMTGPSDGKLKKGMIMVCSSCNGVMILGDSDWRPFTREDFNKLPQPVQRQLVITCAGLNKVLGAGKEWSPYDPPTQN